MSSCLSDRHSRSMSFDKLRMRDIVHPAPAPIHRDLDASLSEHASEGLAGELTALVGVEDLRLAEALKRLLEGRDAERHIHGIGQPKSQHRPRRPVVAQSTHQRDRLPMSMRNVTNQSLTTP